MTLVDLNPVEILMIIDLLKLDMTKLRSNSPPEDMKDITKDQMNVMAKEIKSIIYKLEKSLEKK